MIDNFKKLIKGTATYAIGDFGTRILSFLIIPLYTYYISTEEMGIYDLLISTSGLLIPLITLQVSDASYRWIISKKNEASECITATYKVLLSTSILFILIAIAFNNVVDIPYVELFVLLVIASSWYTTILKIVRALENQKLYAIIGVIYTSIYLSLNVLQIVAFKKKVDSLLISSVIGYFICIFFVIYKEPQLRKFSAAVRPDLIRQFVVFSLPLIPNYLNWWVINSSDSYIVTLALGTSANGLLSVSHKFPSVLQVFLSLFNTSWQDLSISKHAKEGTFNTKTFEILSKMILASVCVLVPATKIFISIIMSEQYQMSSEFVPLYYLGAAYQGFSAFYGVGYLKKGKTRQALLTSVYASTINIIIDLIAIRYIGLHAAALSTFVGFLVMWLVRERQNREELGIIVNWTMIVTLTLTDCLIAYISIATGIVENIFLLLLSTVLFVIVCRKNFCAILKMITERRLNTRS